MNELVGLIFLFAKMQVDHQQLVYMIYIYYIILTSLKYVPNVNKSWKIFKSIWFAFQQCNENVDSCCESTGCRLKASSQCNMGPCCGNCQVRVFLNFYITYVSYHSL